MSESDKDKSTSKAAAFLPVGMGVGLALGAALGLALDNLAIGLGLGVALGAGLGGALTIAQSKKDKAAEPPPANQAQTDEAKTREH